MLRRLGWLRAARLFRFHFEFDRDVLIGLQEVLERSHRRCNASVDASDNSHTRTTQRCTTQSQTYKSA